MITPRFTQEETVGMVRMSGICLDDDAKTLYVAFDHELHVLCNLAAEKAATQDALDAKRYRWLTEDHADPESRKRVTVIADAISVRGKGNTDSAIDAAMAAPTKEQG